MGLPRGQGTRDAEAAAQKEQRAAQPSSTLPSKQQKPRPQGLAEPPLQSPLRCHLGAKRAGGGGAGSGQARLLLFLGFAAAASAGGLFCLNE